MKYELYLKYDAQMTIGLNGYLGSLCEQYEADIICFTDEDNVNKDLGTKIGFFNWVHYNQALAKVHGMAGQQGII